MEVLHIGLHTCEHGTEVGTTRRQDHPVSWHFNASSHQLDVTQNLLTETRSKTKEPKCDVYMTMMHTASADCSETRTHLLSSFISWKAFLMCVWLKVGIRPFTVSSSASMEQFGCGIAGVATRLVRHERQCLDGGGNKSHLNQTISNYENVHKVF